MVASKRKSQQAEQLPARAAGGMRRELFWDRVVFAAALVWTFLSLCFPLLDTDFWWHLKTGEWILQNGQVPYVDLYTFTDSDRPWIDLHWGFQVLVALLYRVGGTSLVTLVKAATLTGAIAIAWQAGGDRLPTWKKAAIWLLPIICITGRGNERPEMLSVLFLAMWLWIAIHTDQQQRWIWWLPLIQLIWVNTHALFVLGVVTGFCYAIDAVVREAAAGRLGLTTRGAAPQLGTVWIVGGLVAVACFMNPYFEEGVLFPATLYRKFSVEKEFYAANIGEFRPPIVFFMNRGLENIYLDAEIGVWIIAFISFANLLIQHRRWSVFRLMMFAGFSHLAWQASRNTNIFSLVAGVVACENFADAQFASPSANAAGSDSRPARRMAAVFGVLSLLVVTGVWNRIAEGNKPFGLGEMPNWFIHDAAKFAGQPGFPNRAFVANNGQAEVYVYHNGPEKKVFMDARLEVCTQRTFEVYNSILYAMSMGNTAWESLFADDELPVVILDSRSARSPNVPSPLEGMLHTPTWRMVFADRSGAVFLPNSVADRLGLPLADLTPLMYPNGPPPSKK